MKKVLLFILLGLLGAVGYSFADRQHEVKARQTADTATVLTLTKYEGESIRSIEVGSVFHTVLRVGEQTGIRLSVDSRFGPYLICRLQEGRLKIGMRSDQPEYLRYGRYWVTRPTVEITVRSIDRLTVSGVAQVKVCDPLRGDRFDLEASGCAKIEGLNLQTSDAVSMRCSGVAQVSGARLENPASAVIEASARCAGSAQGRHQEAPASQVLSASAVIEASGCAKVDFRAETPRLKVQASGASRIEGAGKAENLQVSASGSADCLLDNLHAVSADCSASGSADIHCYASETLRASASGSGQIDCAGNPKVRNVENSRIRIR